MGRQPGARRQAGSQAARQPGSQAGKKAQWKVDGKAGSQRWWTGRQGGKLDGSRMEFLDTAIADIMCRFVNFPPPTHLGGAVLDEVCHSADRLEYFFPRHGAEYVVGQGAHAAGVSTLEGRVHGGGDEDIFPFFSCRRYRKEAETEFSQWHNRLRRPQATKSFVASER